MAGRFARALSHLSTGTGVLRRHFNRDAMTRIHDAIANAEQGQAGEIRFAAEAMLPMRLLRRHRDARSRAVEVFSQLRVWDTQANTGVLLYLLWADRAIEIVADRGIGPLVPESAWEAICAELASDLRTATSADAVVAAVAKIGALMRAALPMQNGTPDELPDAPVIL